MTLEAGVDFTINEINDYPAIPGAWHFQAVVDYSLTGLTEDTWIVAVVKGTDDVSEPLFPVVPRRFVLARSLRDFLSRYGSFNGGE